MLPAREMLADLLLDQGEPDRGLAGVRDLAHDRARPLQQPGRRRPGRGKGGERAKAAELFAQLQSLSAKADGSRPELVALRTAYVKKGS